MPAAARRWMAGYWHGGSGVCPPDAVLDPTAAASTPGPGFTNLRKVFSKLGISSRRQLRHCLA
jgi:hypothetical protein